MALEMQNFEALSPPAVKKISWWTLILRLINIIDNGTFDHFWIFCFFSVWKHFTWASHRKI